jgi:hypothetical protein
MQDPVRRTRTVGASVPPYDSSQPSALGRRPGAPRTVDGVLADGRLRDLRGETVVITGYLSSPRADFVRRVRRAGAVYSEDVTSATTVLVHGAPNALYAYRRATGEPYGTNLAEVDRQRRAGRKIAVITGTELDDLLTGPGLTRAETDAAQ